MDKQKNHGFLSFIMIILITGYLMTTLISFYVSRTSLKSSLTQDALPLTSMSINEVIEKVLQEPIIISKSMANNTFIHNWINTGEKDTSIILSYLRENNNIFKTFTCFLGSAKTLQYYESNGEYVSLAPERSNTKWFYRCLKMDTPYEINVDFDNDDSLTTFINYKVFDKNDSLIGITGVGITLSSFSDRIQKFEKKYHRTIYFINKTGEKIVSSIPNDSSTIFSRGFKGQISLITSKKKYSFSYNSDHGLIHAYASYIDAFGWYLVVEEAESKSMKETYYALLINLLICGAVTAIILFLINITIKRYQKNIETLRGILPICSYCKQIRNDNGYWSRVEEYVTQHSSAEFSHSICPECLHKYFPDIEAEMNKE